MNTFFRNNSYLLRPIKRLARLLALFITLSLFCAFVCSCQKKDKETDYYAYISELRSNILLAQDDDFSLRVYAVEKEYPYATDGVKHETTKRMELYLIAPSFEKQCTIAFEVDGKSYGGELSFDSVKAQYYYSCSLDISSLEQLPCNIRFGEREKVLVAKTVKTPSTLTPKKVLQSVKEKESELFSSLTDEYGFTGEIYLRLIFEEKPYYYLGVIDKKGNITAFLINAENGNILAKRQS